MSREAYDEKISYFVRNNNFICTTKDLPTKFQRELRNVINECCNLIHKDNKWKYVNLNPFPPNIRGLVKIHKQGAAIRPVINRTEAPACKLAKQLVKTLETHIPLTHIFNVKNSVHLMNDLNEIPFDKELKFVSFDVSNMYTNIPTNELIEIIENMCKRNGLEQTIYNDIIKTCKLVTAQNYCQHANNQYIQEQGLVMGAPTSSILSEVYLHIWKVLSFLISS